MIMCGQGSALRFEPGFEDMVLDKNTWAWEGQGGSAAPGESPTNVTPVPATPDSEESWFFGTVADGKACVTLTGDWPLHTEMAISVHIETNCGQLDLDAPDIRLEGGGSLSDCAMRVKDTLTCAIAQQLGIRPDEVILTCTPNAAGTEIKITLEIAGKPILNGTFNVCVTRPPDTPMITAISPLTFQEDDVLCITGTGFGTDPNDLWSPFAREDKPSVSKF